MVCTRQTHNLGYPGPWLGGDTRSNAALLSVEITDRQELYDNPLHPYTRALLSAVPIPDPVVEINRAPIILKGEIPSPLNPPSGCVFHPRCLEAKQECSREVPELKEIQPNHWVSCL